MATRNFCDLCDSLIDLAPKPFIRFFGRYQITVLVLSIDQCAAAKDLCPDCIQRMVAEGLDHNSIAYVPDAKIATLQSSAAPVMDESKPTPPVQTAVFVPSKPSTPAESLPSPLETRESKGKNLNKK